MKYFTLFIAMVLSAITWANLNLDPVQYKRQDSDHLKEIFKAWNNDKGEYLYESIAALVMNEEQPDRPKGITQTPFEMLQGMEDQRVARIGRIIDQELENEMNATRGNRENYYWKEWNRIVQSSRCEDVNKGRSNGDPHMTTFDGARYDFQNAGDYLLAGSNDERFSIQTQMYRPNNSSKISQNSGVAMNVNGDVVEFRRTEGKDEAIFLINGEEMLIDDASYILNQGGAIEKIDKKRYRVKWPTGEQAVVKHRGSNKNRMFDVDVYVPKCNEGEYFGLLGDNDGDRHNDLIVGENYREDYEETFPSRGFSYNEVFGPNRRDPAVRDRKQNQGRYISRTFGDNFMLDEESSMFTVQMVDIPEEVRYPSEHLSLAELSDEQVEEGLRKARELGIENEDDLFAAVYDLGHIGLEPEVETDDYSAPNRKEPTVDPVIEDKREEQKGNSSVRDNNTNNSTIIVVPPRYPRTPPVYRNPGGRYPNTGYPSNTGSGVRTPTGSGSTPTANPNSGRRTPSSGGEGRNTRTPSNGRR